MVLTISEIYATVKNDALGRILPSCFLGRAKRMLFPFCLSLTFSAPLFTGIKKVCKKVFKKFGVTDMISTFAAAFEAKFTSLLKGIRTQGEVGV